MKRSLDDYDEEELMMEELIGEGVISNNKQGQKKRRLSVEQVKALEKKFEIDNKLDPDRKLQLAHDLCLHPRQVAVWFQNRRARWKTKQLERDFGLLNSNFESLRRSFDSLHRDNLALRHQIKDLKTMMGMNSDDDDDEEKRVVEDEDKTVNNENGVPIPQDSDGSSAILNEDQMINNNNELIMMNSNSNSNSNCLVLMKIEEQEFEEEDSTCNLFADDQPPTLHWYQDHPHQWI